MKKSIFLFFAAILCATSAWAAKERVYFVNTPGWAKVNVYAWTDGGASLTWPGTAATKDSWQWNGKDVYYYEAEAGTYKKCIFNNGSGSQSADLTWTANSVYANEAGKWTPVEIAKATTNGTKVYFVNTEKWTTIKVYAFSFSPKDTKNAAWPGANATKESDKVGEYDVYSFTMNKEYDYCIFTNGASSNTKQTADLVVMDGADKYYCKDNWYTKEEAIAKLVAPIEYETVYFVNAADWTGTISAYAYTPVQNASWPGEPAAKEDYQIGGKNVYSYTAEKGKYKNVIFSGTGGQTADLTWTAGKYYVRDDWYTKEEAEAKLAVPVVDVYTVVGSENLFVSAWAPSAEANDMEKQDDGSYKKVYSNVELTSDVIWKIAKNDDWWTGPSFNNQDNALAIAKSGIYNVTFVLSADLKTATAEAELLEETNTVADCYISGNAALTGGAGWAGNEFKMEYDDATETYSYTLTGLATDKAYELKVVLGGSWLGYDKLQTVLAGVENKDGNIAFTLATVGDVVVTYNKDNGINLSGNFYVAQDYYTVVGTEVLFGTPWDITSEANKMEKQPDGSYKLVKENVTLAAIEYEWKITKNGTDWMDDNKTVNPVGNNKIKISTAGRYNVTFTLAADIKSAKAEIELIEAAVVIPDCFISGNKNLTGKETEWLGNEFTMVYDEANETWSYTLAGLQPEKEYALKVVCGGTWYSYANLTSIPTGVTKGNDDAIAFKMKEAGDVTVTYNIENGITINGNFYVAPTYAYYIAGNMNGWAVKDENFGMTDENADGIYEKEITLAAGQDHQFKVTNGKWGNEEGGFDCATVEGAYEEVESKGGNVLVKLNAETTFTVIFDATAKKITFEGLTEIVATELVYKVTVPAGTPNCYIVFGDAWDAENAPAMIKVDDTHYTYTRTGLKSDEYKYLYGQSWDFVEVRVDNRTWAEEDVVENWNNPYTEVRTGLTAGNYYTICMTKEMKQVKGATLWSFCGKDANFAYLVQEDAPYTAGKAYIMYAEAETVSAILTGEPALAPVANGAIHGTFNPMDQAALDAAATAAGGDIYLVIGNQLRLVNGQADNSLPANRAYVVIDEITGGAPAGIPANRVRSMPMQPQVATGMENVDASAQPVKTIINGQLYILRGEKMYDAQGKLVK